MDTSALEKKVSEQGAVVRNLKQQKASQEQITEAVNTLLAYKAELKEAQQVAVANLIEEIEKLKLENADETVIASKQKEVEDLQNKINPPKEAKKPKEKKEQGPSKKELRKLKRAENISEQKSEVVIVAANDTYGDLPLIQSAKKTDRVWTELADVESKVDQDVWIRGRAYNINHKGKCCFIILRQSYNTIQCALFQSKETPKEMINYAGKIPKESIIDVYGKVSAVPNPVQSTSIQNFEISVKKIFIVSRVNVELPFQVDAAARSEEEIKQNEALAEDQRTFTTVLPDTKLDYRWIDLRTPANQAIFRIQSGVCQLFREYLYSKGFFEIHSPKINPGTSEGGSEVFKLDYFGTPCCLAQSPQLYKQMSVACGDFERVFEIGPVFRAENSNTHRHLCEFVGLDLEMVIKEHYSEALDVIGGLFHFIFDGLNQRYAKELAIINKQYPFEPLIYPEHPVIIPFTEGMKMLQDAGVAVDPLGDLSSINEKKLGALVREKYHTDFYILDKFPLHVRPFYTMPDPNDSRYSNSYDMFIRGEEIVSGAQRIHDTELLKERAKAWGIPLESLHAYLQSFQHGAYPHAGAGIGLERVCMLFLGLPNIRKTSLFPRDPKRCSP